MSIKQKSILLKTFLESQFGYFSLVWMFHSRTLNKINNLHERTLRIVYRNYECSYKDLLKWRSLLLFIWETRSLANELFKVKENISSHLMNDAFQMRDTWYRLKLIIGRNFKEKIKWEPSNCNCKLCLPYIQNIGYINDIQILFQLFWKSNPIKHQCSR